MSAKKDFIASTKADRLANGKIFKDEAAIDGTTFGLTAVEVLDAGAKWDTFNTETATQNTMEAALAAQVDTTQAADSAFEAAERKYAGKMKKSDGYTETVGDRYKIIGEGTSFDLTTLKPILVLKKVPHGWEVDFNLHNHFSGVKIYRERPGGVSTFLATDTASPYVDNEVQVSGTKYTAYYLIGDDEVAQLSDEAVVEV